MNVFSSEMSEHPAGFLPAGCFESLRNAQYVSWPLSSHPNPEQEQDDLGQQIDDDQDEKHHQVHRQGSPNGPAHADFPDGTNGEQRRASRRRRRADAQVQHHDHAEVNGVDADGLRYGQKHRRRDPHKREVQGRRAVAEDLHRRLPDKEEESKRG